jgi:hypothetical protein
MKSSLKLLLALLFCSFVSTAQTGDGIFHRTAYKLKVAVDPGHYYEEDIEASPYIIEPNILIVYPGEVVFMEIDEKDGVISGMRCVKTIKHPEKTLKVRFTQEVAKGRHEIMALEIANPFERELSYDANLMVMNSRKWVKAPVSRINPKSQTSEMWPDIVTSIALSGWKFGAKW